MGRIQPHCEVKIVDDDGNTCAVGETGEFWARGYLVMKGYWQDEAATRASIEGGWMKSGDLATIDAQGYCRIVGRKKDMVIRGGENIYPQSRRFSDQIKDTGACFRREIRELGSVDCH